MPRPAVHPRHERFLREYIRAHYNAAAAYRRVYPNHAPDSARVSASKVLSKPNVKRRLAELTGAIMKRADVTVDRILTEYEEARLMAKSLEKTSDMIAASEKKAKLVGLLRDRIETGGVGDFDGIEDVSEVIERVRDQAGEEAASALLKAFNLVEKPAEDTDQSALQAAIPPTESVN